MSRPIKSKNSSKKDASTFVKVKVDAEMETIDAYFNRKAEESKKRLERIGFPEQLVTKK
jgi:hypothetical protein